MPDTNIPPALTIAERIAAALGNDGMRWSTPDGTEFEDLVAQHGGAYIARDPRRPDVARYTFADGSIITAAGDAWDLGYADCWCWQGCQSDNCDSDHRTDTGAA
jgi:hypothetical protein